MITNSIYFKYAGIKSTDFGLMNVSTGNGMMEEDFVANRTVTEDKVRGRAKSYFKGMEYEPLSLRLTIAFEDTWTNSQIRAVARWLTNQSYYQPLELSVDGVFNDDDDFPAGRQYNRVYYAISTDSSSITHNGIDQGYFTITFKTNAPWAYYKEFRELVDLSTNTSYGQNIIIENIGDLELQPKILVEKVGNGALEITNIDNNSAIVFSPQSRATNYLKMTGTVYDGETIKIGKEIFEFDTGDKEITTGNIMIDVSETADYSVNKLIIDGSMREGDTVTVGNDIYEFDGDGVVTLPNIKVDISSKLNYAKGKLTINDNPSPKDYIVIGNTRYVFDLGTNDSVLKLSAHNVGNSSGNYCMINRQHPTNVHWVTAINRDYLKVVEYESNNPFLKPGTVSNSAITGQLPKDVIELYQSKFEGVVEENSTKTDIFCKDTQSLRSGDLIALATGYTGKDEHGNDIYDTLEIRKIASVTMDVAFRVIGEFTKAPSAKDKLYCFNRISLKQAEDVDPSVGNSIVIGSVAEDTLNNIVGAINLAGDPGKDYGIQMSESLLVGATKLNSKEIEIKSKYIGSVGNDIQTISLFTSINNKFDNSFLTGGADCPSHEAIILLVSAINTSGAENVRVFASDSTSITFKCKIAGTIGNGIIGLTNTALKSARWEKDAFDGGIDPSKNECISKLLQTIGSQSSFVEVSTVEDDDYILELTAMDYGSIGNMPVKTNTMNLFFGSTEFQGGNGELQDKQQIEIDCENKQLQFTGAEPIYDIFNNQYITLEVGENMLNIKGKCKITFILNPKILQG